MLVNNCKETTSILKRARSVSISSESPKAKKMAGDPTAEKCALLLERLRETGLASCYSSELEELASASEEVQLEWLLQFTHRVIFLDKSVTAFVQEIVKLPWKLSESQAVSEAYHNFVVALATAHSGHCKIILSHLFRLLLPDVSENDQLAMVNPHAVPSSMVRVAECSMQAIALIHTKVPLSERLLLREASVARPYYKKHVQLLLVFCKCLMMLSLKIPSLRRVFLEMIVQRMVDLDANSPRKEADGSDDEEEEEEEMEGEVVKMDEDHCTTLEQQNGARLDWILQNPVRHSLDVLMETLVLYMHCVSHDVAFCLDRQRVVEALGEAGCVAGSVAAAASSEEELTLGCGCAGQRHNLPRLKKLYLDLSAVFTKIVLPTHSSGHVQFFMFYFLSMKPSLTHVFLEMLRTDYFMGNGVALDIKKNALAYMGSLLARGKFVAISTALSCLEVIVNWCHEYISLQEKEGANNYPSLTLHERFYCACQTVFYVFTFRSREFTRNEKMLDHVRRLNLERLVFSKLNPLALCRNQIVKSFAAITRHFQLAYCYAVIESNKRNTLPVTAPPGDVMQMRCSFTGFALDMAFPFDPYQLLSSAPYIEPHYRQFPGLPHAISLDADADGEGPQATEDDDDFLDQSCLGSSAPKTNGLLEYHFSPISQRKN